VPAKKKRGRPGEGTAQGDEEGEEDEEHPQWMRIVASLGPPELFELRRRRQAPASSLDIVEWLTA